MSKLKVEKKDTGWGYAIPLLVREKIEGALEVGLFSCEVGKALERHDHGDAAEWCYIISGQADFDCDGEITHASPSDLIYLPARSNHTSYPTGDEPFVSLYIVCKDN